MTTDKLPPLPEALYEALKSGDWGDFSYNDEPKCPHCGEVHGIERNESWRLYEEGEHEIRCTSCDMDFSVSTHIKYAFSTDTQEDYP